MTALFTRASLIVLSAAALAACADVKPEYPTSAATNPPPAPPPMQSAPVPETPPGEEGTPRAVPTAPLTAEALPPVNRRPGATQDTDDIEAAPAPVQTSPPPRPYTPPSSYSPPPTYTPEPTYAPPPVVHGSRRSPPPAPTYILSVKGPVRAAKDKTRTVKVDQGDTVNNLSERYLTPKAELIKLNKLKKPYELEVGRPIKIPTPKAYIVESGDTLFGIAKRFNLSTDLISELNNIDPSERVRAGEEIALPTDVKDSGPLKRPGPPAPRRGEEEAMPAPEQPTYRPPEPSYRLSEPTYRPAEPTYRPQPPVRPEPPTRYAPQPATPLIESSPAPSDAQVTAAGRGRFIWPVTGQTLSGFGSKPGGQRNDGVDIGAPSGTVGEGRRGGRRGLCRQPGAGLRQSGSDQASRRLGHGLRPPVADHGQDQGSRGAGRSGG